MYALILTTLLHAQPCPCGPACDCSPCVCPPSTAVTLVSLPETREPPLAYDAAYAQACREHKRLVVFVGASGYTRPVAGCVVCPCPRFPHFPEVEPGAVVVGVPDGLPGLARCDLPGGASDEAILAAGPRLAYQSVYYYRPVQYPVFFGGGCANGRCGR